MLQRYIRAKVILGGSLSLLFDRDAPVGFSNAIVLGVLADTGIHSRCRLDDRGSNNRKRESDSTRMDRMLRCSGLANSDGLRHRPRVMGLNSKIHHCWQFSH